MERVGSYARDAVTKRQASNATFRDATVGRGMTVTAKLETVMDEGLSEEKTLGLPRRAKSAHLPFTSSGRLVRVFGPVSRIPAPSMLDALNGFALRRSGAWALVGHDDTGNVGEPLEQFPKEASSCLFIATRLEQHVQRIAVLIHRAPQVMDLALDPDKHLIGVPFITGTRALLLRTLRVGTAEALAPGTNSLVGNDNSSLGQDRFHVTQAQRETMVEPHGMRDDNRWVAEPTTRGIRNLNHDAKLARQHPGPST